MTDARMVVYDYGGDIIVENGDLRHDNGLYTAVLISLFSDARAPIDAELPQLETTRRGWWNDRAQEFIGSLLWLVARETTSERRAVAARAREFCILALRWMIDEGIAAAVEVEASIQLNSALQLVIRISRGSAKEYQYLWDAIAESEQIQFGNTSVQLKFLP